MKVTKKDDTYETGGAWGALLAIPIVCLTFSWLAVMLLTVVFILLSPVILIVWLIIR